MELLQKKFLSWIESHAWLINVCLSQFYHSDINRIKNFTVVTYFALNSESFGGQFRMIVPLMNQSSRCKLCSDFPPVIGLPIEWLRQLQIRSHFRLGHPQYTQYSSWICGGIRTKTQLASAPWKALLGWRSGKNFDCETQCCWRSQVWPVGARLKSVKKMFQFP